MTELTGVVDNGETLTIYVRDGFWRRDLSLTAVQAAAIYAKLGEVLADND